MNLNCLNSTAWFGDEIASIDTITPHLSCALTLNCFQNRRLMKSSSIFTFCLALCSVPAFAGTLIIGAPASLASNCIPFGCAYAAEYQQVYNQGQFSGPITITGLDFYNTQTNSGATAMNSGNWSISLSTTSADWSSLSSTFASNLGANNTTVFSGNLSQPWTFGDTLKINFTTPFTYDPSEGNLLLDVFASGTSSPGGLLFFDANFGNSYLGRVYDFGGSAVNSGYGLVTGFETGEASPIPEPSSFLLLGTGLMAAAGMIRRKIRI